jgi:agmatinase
MLYMRNTFEYEYPIREAEAVVLGMPFDTTGTGLCTRHGPLFVREAIRNLTGWDAARGNLFEAVKFADMGDVDVVPGNWPLTRERIADSLEWLMKENPGAIPVVLGGEHLITLACIEALRKHKGPFTVVHLDAHRDLMPDWMGNPYSHVTWAHHALKSGFDVVQAGCRVANRDEPDRGLDLRRVKGPVYLTIDLDVFDPAFAPDVGNPEANGLSPAEFLGLLRRLDMRWLAGMDIVECASQRVGTPTAALAAWVLKEALLGWKAHRRPPWTK